MRHPVPYCTARVRAHCLRYVSARVQHSAPVLPPQIGWTALHLASSHGHHQAAERLLKAGAHVDAADEVGRGWWWQGLGGQEGIRKQVRTAGVLPWRAAWARGMRWARGAGRRWPQGRGWGGRGALSQSGKVTETGGRGLVGVSSGVLSEAMRWTRVAGWHREEGRTAGEGGRGQGAGGEGGAGLRGGGDATTGGYRVRNRVLAHGAVPRAQHNPTRPPCLPPFLPVCNGCSLARAPHTQHHTPTLPHHLADP